jgi:DNA-3-methyladenine glycosylase II
VSQTFEMSPRGAFDLASQQQHFGGWLAFQPDLSAVAMALPVEGWEGSAIVVVRQPDATTITGEVHGCVDALAPRAWAQALATLSLDIDGTGFAAVGERDPVIGQLQRAHAFLRPTLFHSPYEAACNFVIGQRISMAQSRAIRLRMATDSGERMTAHGVELAAFPTPQRLLELTEVRGLAAEKMARLHGIARAALDGVLDRERLRSMPTEAALAAVSALRGVGPFSAQGIVFRGAGVVDEVTDEPVSKQAVQRLYGLDHLPGHAEVARIAEHWRPFRMWSLVLLHVWVRSDRGGPAPVARHGRRGRPPA